MRTPRFKVTDETGYYHCVSRVVDGRFVFGDVEKEMLARMLRHYATFCGAELVTFCVMSNHFHVLVKVPPRPSGENLPDDAELIRRLGAILQPARVREIARRLEAARATGDDRLVAEIRDGLVVRMWDISAFMKEVKQKFTLWFNRHHHRRGTLWEERFRSVVVEGSGRALASIAAYVDLNPVRAGIVKEPSKYRWSGYGRAFAGRPDAIAGLRNVAPFFGLDTDCTRAPLLRAYGAFMNSMEGTGEASTALYAAPKRVGQRGRPRKAAESGSRAGSEGGSAPAGNALRLRVRYFVDGEAIGSREFVEGLGQKIFGLARARAEERGSSNPPPDAHRAHRFRGGLFKDLFTYRNLQVRVYEPPTPAGSDGAEPPAHP